MTHDGNCCEVFLQFRHSQVVKSSFCLYFSIFLLGKQLLLNFFRDFHLLNPKKMSQTFSKPRAMLNKTKKTNVPWHHPCICTLRDHGQRPITARVAFTSLYNVICLTDGVCIIFLNMKIKFLSKTIVLRSVFRLLYSLFCKLNQAFSLLVYIQMLLYFIFPCLSA